MKVGYQILADLQQQQAFKQWGKILGDTVNLKIINFPVSFNECFGGLALFNGDPVAAAEYATITDITNTNFKIYMYANNAGTGYANANIFYLFLGAQPQWGVGAASTNIMLPIPYTKVKFITLATSSMLNPSQGNISVAYHDSTLDSIRFQIRWQGLAAEYTGAWLTLGI